MTSQQESAAAAAAAAAARLDEDPTTTAPQQQQQQQQQLRLFLQLDDAQNHHGIPMGDYAQYAGYCTRKLTRLRHHPAVRHWLVHNPKYYMIVVGKQQDHRASTATATTMSKRRHAYCPRNEWKMALLPTTTTTTTNEPSLVEEEKDEANNTTTANESPSPLPIHENIVWNLLFQAERAWAQACALQQQQQQQQSSTTTTTTKKKNTHRHVQRRFNKAVQWATALAQYTVVQHVHATTRKEAQAYVAWMMAHAALEHRDYVAAFRQYSQARQMLLQLASSSSTDQFENNNRSSSSSSSSGSRLQSLAIRDVWTQRAETVILPVLRYCHYEAKDALTAPEISQVTTTRTVSVGDSQNNNNNNNNNQSSIVLSFRGQAIALDGADDASYQPIAVLYLKMEDSLQHPDTLNENQFLQLLSDLDDAIRKVADEMQKYQAIANPGPAVTAKRTALAALEGWFRYHQMLIWSYQQEQHVAEFQTAQNFIETVHLYEALQQNAVRMAELPGLDHNEEEEEEDDPYRLEALAHVVRLRAFRCYYLALVYEQQSQQSSSSSKILTLLQHASKLATRAREEIMACHEDPVPALVERHVQALDQLRTVQIRAVACRVRATQYVYYATTTTTATGTPVLTKTNRPLWMRLEECDVGTVLADVPLRPLPIPCKGVAYDLAGARILGNKEEEWRTTLEHYIRDHDDDVDDENQDEPSKKTGFWSWWS